MTSTDTRAAGPHETWEPIEIALRADEPTANPYTDREVSATFEHDSGATHEVAGFPDGGRDWAVRFAPPRPGEWTWETGSDPPDPGLERAGRLEVRPYDGSNPLKRHGFLEARERHLAHADGTPFFWLGDTAWSASAKATPEEWTRYLDARAEQGYTVVQLNALPQHDAARPYRRLPFGEEWDLDSPRPSYFRALDGLVAAASARGIVPALVVLWFNYVPGANADWGEFPRHPFDRKQAERWGRYLGARYGAYGAVWLVSGDWEFDGESLSTYDAAAAGVRSSSTHPLCAAHMPGGHATAPSLNDREWLDVHAYQSGHGRGEDGRAQPRELAERHREMAPARPVLDAEPCYENMGSHDGGPRFTRAEVRAAGWQSVLAGASAGLTYGGNGIWQWYREGESFEAVDWLEWMREPLPWEGGLSYPGADDYATMKAFLTDFAFEALEPRQDATAVDDPAVRAAALPEDDVLLVYTPASRAIPLAGPDPRGAEWLDPATAARVDAGVDDGTVAAPPWRGDAVLIVETD